MAPASQPDHFPAGWQPPGQRWGRGAQTVVPYLHHANPGTRRGRAAEAPLEDTAPVRNPVFQHMDAVLKRRGV